MGLKKFASAAPHCGKKKRKKKKKMVMIMMIMKMMMMKITICKKRKLCEEIMTTKQPQTGP